MQKFLDNKIFYAKKWSIDILMDILAAFSLPSEPITSLL